MMATYKIERAIIIPNKLKKSFYPFLISSTANRRAANLKPQVHLFYRARCTIIKLKILVHVGILPETLKIRLVPDFNRPLHNLFASIPLNQMKQSCPNKVAPPFVAARRSNISLPVKNSLLSACKLLRHKAKLNKRTDFELLVRVHNHIKISPVIFNTQRRRFRDLFARHIPFFSIIFVINKHILAKKPVSADMLKADFFLDNLKLFVILLLKGKSHSSSTDAVKCVIIERYIFFSCDFVFHNFIIPDFPVNLYEDFILFLYIFYMILAKEVI